MSTLGEWLNAYLQALPDTIRGNLDDRRLIEAARMALHHGWAPQRAARTVAARNYRGANHPTLLAIIRLEDIAAHPPGTAVRQRRTPHPNGCQICTPTQTCDDPATAQLTPERITELAQPIHALIAAKGGAGGRLPRR